MKNYKILILTVIFLLLYLSGNFAHAQSTDETVAKFLKRSYNFESTTLPYRLFVPDNYETTVSYPLVLCLHGVGACGTDNERQIKYHRLATSWADTVNQHRWPCFVVAPQCPTGKKWAYVDPETRKCNIDKMPISEELLTVDNLLNSLIREFSIDQNRLYITGLSMGGFGTWDMIARFPNKFAAAVPMSGGGDTSKVSIFTDVPVWNFHGALDNSVPVSFSREMCEAYNRNGIAVVQVESISDSMLDFYLSNGVKHLYTEYPNGSHMIWAESYDYPKLFPWVFSQSRSTSIKVQEIKMSLQKSFNLNQNYPNPFNPSTAIKFYIPNNSYVSIKIYGVLGGEVTTLINEQVVAGYHTVHWNGKDKYGREVSSGVYFYQIRSGSFVQTKKMLLLK